MAGMETGRPWRPFSCSANDGLRLGGRDWGDPDAPAVVCLPGLSRNARDFDALAAYLSSPENGGRRVLVLDYRGRGSSERDPDWANYSVPVEQADIHTALAAAGIDRAAIVGTSRGGLHGMLMAAATPERVQFLILNDVGPKLESAGIARIARSLAGPRRYDGWPAAVAAVKRANQAAFPGFGEPEWTRLARQLMREDGLEVVADCDPTLVRTLQGIDPETPLPALWEPFEQIAAPMMLIRGALSDVLARETVTDMRRRTQRLEVLEVPNQGHAPVLWEADLHRVIGDFLAQSSS